MPDEGTYVVSHDASDEFWHNGRIGLMLPRQIIRERIVEKLEDVRRDGDRILWRVEPPIYKNLRTYTVYAIVGPERVRHGRALRRSIRLRMASDA